MVVLDTLRQKFRYEKSEQSKLVYRPEADRGYEKGNVYQTASDTKMNESRVLWNLGVSNQQSAAGDVYKAVSPWYEPKIDSGFLRSVNQDKTLLESETSDGERPRTNMEIEDDKHEQYRLPSRVHESRSEAFPYTKHQLGQRRGSLDGYRASLSLSYSKDREKAANQNGKGESHNPPAGYNEAPSMTQESSFDVENSRTNMDSFEKSASIQEGTAHYFINQWVDEKLNGFSVFQNSLKSDNRQNIDEFNKFSSQEWFKLSRLERDQYTKIAMAARPGIKEELLKYDTADLRELKEIAHQKIKQVKK